MERILAIEDQKELCWKCLKPHQHINNIKIPEMDYGSIFDGESTEIHLCEDCYQESIRHNHQLWDMETVPCKWNKEYSGVFREYKYEKEMIEYIENLPLQGRQFVENEFSSDGWNMAAQDWIDYQLGMMSSDDN